MLIILIPSIVIQFPFYHSSDDFIGTFGAILCVIQLVILIGSIIPTEKALKENFTDDGIRR